MYKVIFFDAINKKGIQYTNVRNFQYSYNRNKSGNANFQFDVSPESRSIRAGWLVEIYRNEKKVYFGQVIKRTKKKGLYKIFANDVIGMINRRLLTQRPTTEQEASLEVIEKLDGLVLVGNYKLKADSFVEKTNTSMRWHSEGNSLMKYIGDIGEQSINFSGDSNYFFWISPNLDVYFSEDGGLGYHNNLRLSNVTYEEDISKTFNSIEVEGLPILRIPYDGDAWTEYEQSGWDGGVSGNPTYTTVQSYVGQYSIVNSLSTTTFPVIASYGRSLLNDGKYMYLDNAENVNFMFYLSNSDAGAYLYIGVSFSLVDGSIIDVGQVMDTSVSGSWQHIVLDFSNENFTSRVKSFNLYMYARSATNAYDYYIDNLYIELKPPNHIIQDQLSIDKYGLLEKKFIARDFYSNAECEDLAKTLLNYYKDVKMTINASLDGYEYLMPNSIIEFEDDGEVFRKVLTSVTYYVNNDGSESVQMTISDPKKSDVDKILDKLAEININNNLLKLPYKMV